MRLLGNIIWVVFGGWLMALGWLFYSLLCFVSIIGIPWGRACFVFSQLALWPFGRMVVSRRILHGENDIGTGVPGMLGNIIWLLLGGVWLALSHLMIGLLLCLTIIGIPFGLQHFKLAELAIFPIGKAVVPVERL